MTVKLTDSQLDMVRHFQKEYFEGFELYPGQKEQLFLGKNQQEMVFEELTTCFEYLSQKSLLLQRINKVLIFAGSVGSGIGWFLFSWTGVGIAVASFIVINLTFGAWHSRDIRKHTGWDDDVMRSAHDLITEPVWQQDI